MIKKQTKTIRGFTLIEMLIVLGIVAILSMTMVMSLNPAEAQRKSRDAKRMKDVNTISSLLNQAINDGVILTSCLTGTDGCNSKNGGDGQSCSSNWLSNDFCRYTQVVPVDPLNNTNVSVLTTGAVNSKATITNIGYKAKVSSTDYEAGVYLESEGNRNYLSTDGNVDILFQSGNNLTLITQ